MLFCSCFTHVHTCYVKNGSISVYLRTIAGPSAVCTILQCSGHDSHRQRRLKLPRPVTLRPNASHAVVLMHSPWKSACWFLHLVQLPACPTAKLQVWQSSWQLHKSALSVRPPRQTSAGGLVVEVSRGADVPAVAASVVSTVVLSSPSQRAHARRQWIDMAFMSTVSANGPSGQCTTPTRTERG